MGMMDDTKSKMSDMGNMDDMRDRFEELKSKEQAGDLDDSGREELQQLRSRFTDTDSQ
jgi:DNA-binding transcriptional regulator YbjK